MDTIETLDTEHSLDIRTIGPLYSGYEYKRAHKEFYGSKIWGQVRTQVLEDNPLCVMCSTDTSPVLAIDVDHCVLFIDEYDPLSTNMDNLSGLCKRCHAKITQMERTYKYPMLIAYHNLGYTLEHLRHIKYTSFKDIIPLINGHTQDT